MALDNPDVLKAYRIDSEDDSSHHLDSELGADSGIFSIGTGTSNLADEIRPCNSKDGDMDAIAKACNDAMDGWSPVVGCNPLGSLVPPGCIRFADYQGRTYAVGPGRWMLKPSKYLGYLSWSDWDCVKLMESNQSEKGTASIVRIAPDEIGLAYENATEPVLLGPGLHVYNTPSFKFVKKVGVQEAYFHHGIFHVLRVKRGTFALVWENPTQPRILREGTYAVKSPNFSFSKFVNVEEHYIKHGTIHIIQVPKGHVAKVFENMTPKLLSIGVHMVDHPNFHFDGLELLSSSLIKHGTITRFRVGQGEIGLASWRNEAVFIDVPGTYEIDSPDFVYLQSQSVSNKLLHNGNKKVVTVFSGEVGLSYRAGCLDVMEPGRHIISAADHYFDSFLSTQQHALRLKDTASSSSKEDEIVAETKDFVKVGICADIFYSIADANKTVVRVGKDGVHELVMETAIGTLTNIIRSTALNEIAQSQNVADAPTVQAPSSDPMTAQALGQPSAPLFFDRAHDEFLARLHDDFLERYGIEISNIRMASCRIMDSELSKAISEQALTTAQTENKLANLKGQTEIATAEQERQSRVEQLRAEQEARALNVRTESQAKAQLDQANSLAKAKSVEVTQEAEAKIAQARAEAEAIKLKAEAEASAIETKAKAEAERARRLSETPLGAQLALLELWSGTVEKSNEGISKVVYCDPSVQLAAGGGNPLGLHGLNTLQGELSKLSGIGNPTFGSGSGQ
jgi:regulator of protease activity HflC (stomatin/prohibitin superfamily)